MDTITHSTIRFELPEHLACSEPTETRNIRRDEVRLLVTHPSGEAEHNLFHALGSYLRKGDVLVVNTSATRASALPVLLPGGQRGVIHFSTKINEEEWLIEIREIRGDETIRWKKGAKGMVFYLPAAGRLRLKERFYNDERLLDLWTAEFNTHLRAEAYLATQAQPIKYKNLSKPYPLAYYQTFFSFHLGSAEMPSASRGFTGRLVENLLKKGVVFAPVLLHTGISSLEGDEAPYPEYMEVGPVSAAIVNTAKTQGRRIIAVGTTAVRAIESAARSDGAVLPYKGETELFIDGAHKIKIADGLLTGFHEPRASHLHMLQAIAGHGHIEQAYRTALSKQYYWHQFGDMHLILP